MTRSVLFFDGNLKYIDEIQEHLFQQGIDPIFALTSREVIEKIAKYSPSLVIVTCVEPSINLIEINNILKLNNETTEPPIIFISTDSESNFEDSYGQLKEHDIIFETHDKEKFIKSIKRIIRNYFPVQQPEKDIKILVAEDDAVIRRTVEILLKKDGYHNIRLTLDGKEALEQFQQDTPELIILDYMMPYLNGFQILQKIRENYEYDHIPIIFLTALADKERLIEALNVGATDYITKPFDQAELLARVSTHSRNYYLQKQLLKLNEHLGNVNKELSSKNAQIETDLRSARKIQESLLPHDPLTTEHVKISYFYQPSQTVGGDFLNYFQLDDRHIGFYIADVSGHGVTSAMITVFVREQIANILKKYHQNSLTPARILNKLNKNYNKEIYFLNNGVYFTIFFGILDTATRVLDYASAGHHAFPLIIRGNKTVSEIKNTELAVGFVEDYTYHDYQVSLQSSDRIFCHTDGIIEISSKDHVLFGMERLKNFILSHSLQKSEAILPELVHAGEQYAGTSDQNDDIALMIIDIT